MRTKVYQVGQGVVVARATHDPLGTARKDIGRRGAIIKVSESHAPQGNVCTIRFEDGRGGPRLHYEADLDPLPESHV